MATKIDPASIALAIDLDSLLRSPSGPGLGGRPARTRQAREKGGFIMRIPIQWVRAANRISPRARQAADAIWYQRGLKGRDTNLTISIRGSTQLLGLNRKTLRRGLLDLERDGLIAIARSSTGSPHVDIIRRNLPS